MLLVHRSSTVPALLAVLVEWEVLESEMEAPGSVVMAELELEAPGSVVMVGLGVWGLGSCGRSSRAASLGSRTMRLPQDSWARHSGCRLCPLIHTWSHTE